MESSKIESLVAKKKEEINYEKFVINKSLEEYWRADEKVALVLLGLSNHIDQAPGPAMHRHSVSALKSIKKLRELNYPPKDLRLPAEILLPATLNSARRKPAWIAATSLEPNLQLMESSQSEAGCSKNSRPIS